VFPHRCRGSEVQVRGSTYFIFIFVFIALLIVLIPDTPSLVLVLPAHFLPMHRLIQG